MDNPPPQKKGLGPLAWLGIGCGGIIVLAIIGIAVSVMFFGPKVKEFGKSMKEFGEEAQKNPTRATATTMVKFGAGQFEMVAEDDANKRYTVKEKKSGTLTTIYWSNKTQKVETVPGDFSAIPKDASEPSAPSPAPAPAPAN